MPKIVRAEFLSYRNAFENSNKLFNVFVIEDDDETYSCISEYGRRGNRLIRDTLCRKTTLEMAERNWRMKRIAKRTHVRTPYREEPLGADYSQIVRELNYELPANTAYISLQGKEPASAPTKPNAEDNVIAFPVKNPEPAKPKKTGILNGDQLNSLEF